MVSYIMQKAEAGAPAVYDVGLRPLDCWDRGFEFRQRNGYSSLVFTACRVDSGLCEQLISRSEESYRLCVCVSNCVRSRNRNNERA